MFPLRDDVPSRRAPLLTCAIVLANVAVFVWQLSLPEEGMRRLFHLFGVVPARFSDPAWAQASGYPGGGAAAFVTSMFLHGGLFHLLSNVWSLWIFGDNVEDRMGRGRFFAFYLASGLAAGLLHWLTNPASTVPTVGASGAIAGVLGAYLRWFPGARVLTLVPVVFYPLFVELPALVFLGFWFVSQLFSGFLAFGLPADVGGVAWWAHVGGFVFGMAFCGLFARRGREQLPGPARHFVLPRATSTSRRRLPSEWFDEN